MSDLVTFRLKELCSKITDGSHRSPKSSPDGICMYSVKDMTEFGFSDANAKRITEEEYQELKRTGCKPEANDILIAKDGSVLKHIFKVRENQKCVLLSSIAILRPNTDLVDPDYLVYSIKDPTVRNSILSNYVSGSGVPRIVLKNFKEIELCIPSIDNQKIIAHILGTLDDKIELNQKMNQTLEGIAKAIFKSWFVDFDPVYAKSAGRPTGLSTEISDLFPDELVKSEIGDIPREWEIKRTEDVCEKIAMGPFGSNIKVSTFVDQGVPVISGHHLHGFLINEGKYNFVSKEHSERLKNSVVTSGDVIFTHAGTVGQVSLIPKSSKFPKYVISQRQFYARPLYSSLSSYLALFFHSPIGQHKLLSNVSGSGVPSIARPSSHLKGIELVLPPESLIETFAETVGPMIDRMVNIASENKILVELRDTLLPKLISGELQVSDSEKFFEKARI